MSDKSFVVGAFPVLFLNDVAPASGSPLLWGVIVGLLALVGVAWAIVRRRRPPPELPVDVSAPRIESSAAPAVDILADRAEVRGPVRITEAMSLREVREAKRAYLSDEFKASDGVSLEKERRKGKTAQDDTPDEAEIASLPSAEAGTAVATTAETAARAPQTVAEARRAAVELQAGRSLREGLERTRSGFMGRLGALFSKAELNEDLLEQVEEVLFTADVGVKTSHRLLEAIRQKYAAGEITDTQGVWDTLRAEAASIVLSNARSLDVDSPPSPVVLMMVGVNGAGKTTTIGKLAARYLSRGKKVLLVAGDTFRAAAVDQLLEWANRVGVPCHTGAEGAEPSGVIFDGLQRAKEEGFDVVICDTAGRLQTKKPLMDELSKIGRSAAKSVPGAPHETILVLDANTGQNAIQQARLFGEATPLTGIVLTKLDGTAKGGVVLGISDEMKLPIYFVGIGEAVADLRAFEPAEFVEALF